MQRITVPGGWVEFREPEEVPERLRRRVISLAPSASKVIPMQGDEVAAEQMDDSAMGFLFGFNDAVALCLVTTWSWPFPVSEQGLGELPGNVYDEIVKYCSPLVPRLMPNFGIDPDPKALTVN